MLIETCEALLPFPLVKSDDDYRVAFLFTAHNASASNEGPLTINLDGISTFDPNGLIVEISAEHFRIDARTAALLVCDPHISHSGGEALLYPNGTIAITASQRPSVGNIDNSTEFLRYITRDPVSAFFAPDPANEHYLTLSAMQAFFAFDSLSSSGDKAVPPSSLEVISDNLNRITTSIAKAFSSGYIVGTSFGDAKSSLLLDVNGYAERHQLVLGTNSRIFWIGVGLWVVNICLLTLLGRLMQWDEMKPFALQYILPMVEGP